MEMGLGRVKKFITLVLNKSVLPFRIPAWESVRRSERKLQFLWWNTTMDPKKTLCKATRDPTLHSDLVAQNEHQEAAKLWISTPTARATTEQ